MVSNARLDFPLPLGPVTTLSFPSGRSRSIPLRLFWRAPRISTHPRSARALTLSFFPFLEPTGDNRFTRCGLQIFREKYGRSPLPRAELPPLARASSRAQAMDLAQAGGGGKVDCANVVQLRRPSPSAQFGITK